MADARTKKPMAPASPAEGRKSLLPTMVGKVASAALLAAQLVTGSAQASVAKPGSVLARAVFVREAAAERLLKSLASEGQAAGENVSHPLVQQLDEDVDAHLDGVIEADQDYASIRGTGVLKVSVSA